MTDPVADDSSTENPSLPALPTKQTIAIVTATVLISIMFIQVALPFLTALILAGICAELSKPFFQWVMVRVGQREALASTITLVTGLLIVILPTIVIATLAVSQASTAIQGTGDLAEVISEDFTALQNGEVTLPDWLPFGDDLKSVEPKIVEKASELAGGIASFLVTALKHVTSGTSTFFLQLFAFLYALFFFLPMKTSVFAQGLRYSGLPDDLQDALNSKVISVSRATIKGTLTIGMIQGALGGIGFWAAGIEGAVFWAVVMMVMAAIPALGATPVVICGAIYLGFSGEMVPAVGLGLWGVLVVGTIDNVLRPKLVGRDAAMSDLWIFVSTLGGLALFGAVGLVLGPVTAGLFITIWERASGIKATLPEAAEAEEIEEAPTPEPAQGFKITATKAELEVEVEALRRELAADTVDDPNPLNRPSDAGGDGGKG
ncbi:AI-2E family transporter [uncultured Pelagimonas sp.]|uniref:AI-2E family transporter n=1 Tax=uncultured Pelagimonas sp. TaxID=1618102 RepID=UPI00260D8B52|nr:AI-2E family transporter [uncultured Pelagimonas sp.]